MPSFTSGVLLIASGCQGLGSHRVKSVAYFVVKLKGEWIESCGECFMKSGKSDSYRLLDAGVSDGKRFPSRVGRPYSSCRIDRNTVIQLLERVQENFSVKELCSFYFS